MFLWMWCVLCRLPTAGIIPGGIEEGFAFCDDEKTAAWKCTFAVTIFRVSAFACVFSRIYRSNQY
jgi:hypothetical protein